MDDRERWSDEIVDRLFKDTGDWNSLSDDCKDEICEGSSNPSVIGDSCGSEGGESTPCDDRQIRHPREILEELQECMMCPIINNDECDAEGYADNLCYHRNDKGDPYNTEGLHDPTNQDLCYRNCICGYI